MRPVKKSGVSADFRVEQRDATALGLMHRWQVVDHVGNFGPFPEPRLLRDFEKADRAHPHRLGVADYDFGSITQTVGGELTPNENVGVQQNTDHLYSHSANSSSLRG